MPANIAHPSSDLDARIKRIYDHLYANASVRTPAGIATEVGKLIRTAMFLERSADLFPAFSLSSELRRGLLQGSLNEVAKFASQVREQFQAMNSEWQLYNGEGLLLSDSDIAWTCAQLDGVVVSAGKRDVFGDAVEIFRTSWAKQSSGQFFTDSRVTHLAMTLLRFDPFKGDDLVDICCGTGGFLLAGLDHIRKLAKSRVPEKKLELEISSVAMRSLKGQEVDREICDIANGSLICRIGRGARPLVEHGDSISPKAFHSKTTSSLHEGGHRCAASNPPFGTKITIKDHDVLKYYELASPNKRISPRAPDILLLERNVKMLQPGLGRLAIVIPYQILSGPQTRYIREWLLLNTHLEAVIDLPIETFQPHTGTKTSLLVVKRRIAPLDHLDLKDEGTIFMSTPKWIGHDRRGKTVFKRSLDGKPTDEVLSDIEDIALAYQAHLRGESIESVHTESFLVQYRNVITDNDLRLNARYYRDGSKNNGTFLDSPQWTTVRLGDACERIFFPTRFKRNYVEPGKSGIPFLGGSNIAQLLPATDEWLSRTDSRIPELVVREGWLLVTRSGTTGIVSTVPRAWDGLAMSEHVIRIVLRPEKLHPAWVQVYLRSSIGQRALARGIFGSVIDEITPEFIASLEIPIPQNRKIYKEIIEKVSRMEIARAEAIDGLTSAINQIESLFD